MDEGERPVTRKPFTEEQIIGVLKESEAGAKTNDVGRRHGISSAAFYSWRKKYGGMDASEVKRLRELETENAKLKRIVADQLLDMTSMKELLEKKLATPMASRKAVGFLINEMGLSERKACRIVGLSRSAQQRRPLPKDDDAAIKRMKELASENRCHAAVRQCLLAHHGTALRLAVAQIIAGLDLWDVQADPQKASKEAISESLATNAAQLRFSEERQAVADLLGLELEEGETLVPRKADWAASRDLHGLFARLMTLSDDEVLCILAFVTAECLPVGSALVERLGVQLEVNMQDHWQPDQAFLDLMRDKSAINAMLAEIAGEETAAVHITSTAKTSKSIIMACLEGTREAKDAAWHPRYMRFPMDAYTDRGGIRAIDHWTALTDQESACA